MCSTSFGCAVVPDVKYSSSGSEPIGRAVRAEVARGAEGLLLIRVPAVRRVAHRDAGPGPGQVAEPRGVHGLGDDVPDIAARDPVRQVLRAQQRGRRDDDRAELHRGQDDLPQRRDVAEHHQYPVAAAHAEPAQPVGDLVGAGGELGVAEPDVAVGRHHAQRVALGMLGGEHVEPVQCPVEFVKVGPGELGPGGLVVGAVAQQQVARCAVGRGTAAVVLWLGHGAYRDSYRR